MSEKPFHYDGSVQYNESLNSEKFDNEPLALTDEARANMSGNPYVVGNNE